MGVGASLGVVVASPPMATASSALGGQAPSIGWRLDLEPPRPDLSLLLLFGWWVSVLCGGTCGGRFPGESYAHLLADGDDTCGRRSYLIEGVVLGISHTLCCRGRLGRLRVSPRGCPAGLVRRWPVEGGNSRRPRGVASVVAVPATLSMVLVITVVLLGLQRKLCLDSSRWAAMTFQRRFSFLKA